jgi:DNA-binding transcriptional MerR regulator
VYIRGGCSCRRTPSTLNAITAASTIEIRSGVRFADVRRKPNDLTSGSPHLIPGSLVLHPSAPCITERMDVWVDRPMSSDQTPLGEPVFLTSEVARIAGITPRQLQWWDERKLVSPRIEDHRRIYAADHVLEILTVAALRRKGLSLQRIRKVLRVLRRELASGNSRVWSVSRLYLLTDGNSILVEDKPDIVLDRLVRANQPMYLVCLSDQAKRITSWDGPPRHRTQQLRLFDNSARRANARSRVRRSRGSG